MWLKKSHHQPQNFEKEQHLTAPWLSCSLSHSHITWPKHGSNSYLQTLHADCDQGRNKKQQQNKIKCAYWSHFKFMLSKLRGFFMGPLIIIHFLGWFSLSHPSYFLPFLRICTLSSYPHYQLITYLPSSLKKNGNNQRKICKSFNPIYPGM